jgi:cytochrome c-type biogenesis protein CcmF
MAFQPDGGSATVRVILEPLVPWIWAGGALICLAALFAAWPSRAPRAARSPARVPTAVAVPPLSSGPGAVVNAREVAT